MVGFAASLVLLAEEEPDRRPLEAMVAIILILSALGLVLSPEAGGQAVRVAIVQGNSPCPREHCADEKQLIYDSHLGLTRTIAPGSVDLVVWPEDSFGGSVNPTFNPEVAAQMAGLRRCASAPTCWPGAAARRGPRSGTTTTSCSGPNGAILGEYLKRHPVPFGEFVPLRDLLKFIPQLDQVPRDLRRGEGPVVFSLTVGDYSFRLGSVISFEGAFPRYLRSEARAGAQADGGGHQRGVLRAGPGLGPAHRDGSSQRRRRRGGRGPRRGHRALDLRVADGSRAGSETGLFTAEVLYGAVRVQESRRTLYVMTGDWLELAAIAGAGAALVVGWRNPREFRIRPRARR